MSRELKRVEPLAAHLFEPKVKWTNSPVQCQALERSVPFLQKERSVPSFKKRATNCKNSLPKLHERKESPDEEQLPLLRLSAV